MRRRREWVKHAAIFAAAAAAMALAFGAWGRFSAAGRRQFDEMAGILPFMSWYAGLALALLAAICWILLVLRSRRRGSNQAKPGASDR